MAPRISLALAIHNHQPVGNFGWVIADVYERAYEPLVGALERHPGVRMSLHYTGPLLEWLATERPEFVDRVAALAARGQVEVMGGGLYEPILAALPERDRVAQLVRMADRIDAVARQRPLGAWLAERVWEPDLPASLVAAGYRWTILDDSHFRAAAIPEENLWGAYATEDQGHVVAVFGTEQGLRYGIPFGEVDDVIAHLRRNATEAGDRVGVMGDDGEKFGAWPTTWEHCWGRGRWVDRFFEAVEANAAWLSTVTPSEWLAEHAPVGRVYVPTSSYAEMGEWALPADEGIAFADLLHRAVAERRPEARWLRGGFWRNFLVKYREANDLHKQMLRTSAAVAGMPPGPRRDLAVDHLHRGQSNDCYWHGLFGGIYISHMRLATWEHLIAAADLAAAPAAETARLEDLDADGRPEAILEHPGQVVTVDLDEGAGIGEWDIRAARHALAAVLRRRPEAYHRQLRRHEVDETAAAATARAVAAAAAGDSGDGVAGATSIHDLVRVKEEGLASRLHYDLYERRSGLVRFLDLDAGPAAWAAAQAAELGDAVDRPWEVVALQPGRLVVRRNGAVRIGAASHPVALEKVVTVSGTRLAPALSVAVVVENRSEVPLDFRLGVEWATTMLGGGNPAAWWEVAGRRSPHDAGGAADGVTRIAQGNEDLGVRVRTAVLPAAAAWWAPIETVSNSEAGFERVYQGSALLLSWPVRLDPGARSTVRVDHAVAALRDRTLEEVGEEAAAAATPR